MWISIALAKRTTEALGISNVSENSPFQLSEIRIAEQCIEYGHCGDGTPVICLAGRGGAASEQFGALAEALVDARYEALAPNFRGVGASNGSLDQLSLHDYANDVKHLIDHYGGQAHVVGRAFGNRVARCLAHDYPAQVLSLSLIAAGGLIPPASRPANLGAAKSMAPIGRRYKNAGLAQDYAAQSTPLENWWSGGAARMLVIQGLDDWIAVPENGRRLAHDYPQRVRLVEVADAGHGVLFEKPAVVIPEIVAFINSIERESP